MSEHYGRSLKGYCSPGTQSNHRVSSRFLSTEFRPSGIIMGRLCIMKHNTRPSAFSARFPPRTSVCLRALSRGQRPYTVPAGILPDGGRPDRAGCHGDQPGRHAQRDSHGNRDAHRNTNSGRNTDARPDGDAHAFAVCAQFTDPHPVSRDRCRRSLRRSACVCRWSPGAANWCRSICRARTDVCWRASWSASRAGRVVIMSR